MNNKVICRLAIFILFFSSVAFSGVQIGGSRVVYDGKLKQATISITNPDNKSWLIQSWINKNSEGDDNDETFIATPPLFRLEPHSQNSVRIIYTGKKLPDNTESVYWLNIKTIPSTSRDATNQLLITIKNKLKLFYRPAGLTGEAATAFKMLQFHLQDGKLFVHNPTPYNVSFYDVTINGSPLSSLPMIKPLAETSLDKPASKGNIIKWRAINDFGGITSEQSTIL